MSDQETISVVVEGVAGEVRFDSKAHRLDCWLTVTGEGRRVDFVLRPEQLDRLSEVVSWMQKSRAEVPPPPVDDVPF